MSAGVVKLGGAQGGTARKPRRLRGDPDLQGRDRRRDFAFGELRERHHGRPAFQREPFARTATTPNALDATLALNQAALAASAQDLTQDGSLGLDAPRVLTQAVQDRLVASGGALGEGAAGWRGPKGVAGFSFGNANIWARGADQFGSATASGAGVGYDMNRAAPLIAGVDWRLDKGIVAGMAATYVATSAKFKDGSSTNMSSYQGAAYAGWAGGPWYALGSAVVSFNEFGTARLLTPFGLPGDATSSPSGQSYQGHTEAGYHWGVPAAGVNVSVTPYAALDYVNAHLQGFSETGGFGALSVNAADSNSFQTTLGVRLTSRIATAKRHAHSRTAPRLEPRIPRRLAKDHGVARRRCGKRLLGDRHRLRPRRRARGRGLQHGAFPRRQGLRRLRRPPRLPLAGAFGFGRAQAAVLARETSPLCGRSNYQSCMSQGVPLSRTVFASTTSLRAQATTATLWCFPLSVRR